MPAEIPYGFKTTVSSSYADAIVRVTAALKDEGFGVLTEIDVQATLKKKLGVDTRPYVILGACNPTLAHKAMQVEPDIGLLLPCNVVVYESEEAGKTVVAILDPQMMVQMTGNDVLDDVSCDARDRLERVIKSL
jgi:uncharacterized protein (DUF302 family)